MIPIADLQSIVGHKRLAKSLQEFGFTVVVGHDISETKLATFYKSWNDFFLESDKTAFKANPATQTGYFSMEDAETAKLAAAQDLKEYYQFWPGGPLPSSQRQLTLQLYDLMYELATTVLVVLQRYSADELWARLERSLADYLSRPDTMIRILRYPPLTGSEPTHAMRAAAHEDINFITLLPAATQGGLQIKPRQSDWHPVDAPKGAIIVNIGDMLQELTDNKLPSTTHRVINPEGIVGNQARITAPLFCHPESSLRLSNRYTAGEYLRERLNEINLKQMRLD